MSAAEGPDVPARIGFSEELDALRLQVEVMAVRVGDAVSGARSLLDDADPEQAQALLDADDAIDEMHVSLIERCYTILARESPVASDLRLVVSIIRVSHELERIGDLSLRVVKAVDDIPVVAGHPEVFDVLMALADNVLVRYVAVQQGWSAGSMEPLDELERADPFMEYADPLVNQLLALQGPDAARVALAAMSIGRSFDRIGDHTQIMASRLRYLVTGDISHLADEVLW